MQKPVKMEHYTMRSNWNKWVLHTHNQQVTNLTMLLVILVINYIYGEQNWEIATSITASRNLDFW